MKIKICGLRDVNHAVKAAELGADFLGFVFAKSPRRVTPEQAALITRRMPAGVQKVGVFVDEKPQTVNEIAGICGLDLVQLHGSESPAYCKQVCVPVIKAFRVKDADYLKEMELYRDSVEMFLLDTYIPGVAGGTGKVFDWKLAIEASGLGKIIVAGGLNPENVSEACRIAKPFAVDVSGGVETAGVKDIAKIEAFISQARGNLNV
ncbi:MAG TPA: phosphoribosylanthranilate isomerase [Desulfobacteria bacterium]|nr:phosphoribosylanthranilate isomerase [Desulfobacteria bacterium]